MTVHAHCSLAREQTLLQLREVHITVPDSSSHLSWSMKTITTMQCNEVLFSDEMKHKYLHLSSLLTFNINYPYSASDPILSEKCNNTVSIIHWNIPYGYGQSSAKLPVILSSCHPVIWSFDQSLGHSITWSYGHSVTQSLGHLVTRSIGHSVTKLLDHLVTKSLGHSVTWSLGHLVTW